MPPLTHGGRLVQLRTRTKLHWHPPLLVLHSRFRHGHEYGRAAGARGMERDQQPEPLERSHLRQPPRRPDLRAAPPAQARQLLQPQLVRQHKGVMILQKLCTHSLVARCRRPGVDALARIGVSPQAGSLCHRGTPIFTVDTDWARPRIGVSNQLCHSWSVPVRGEPKLDTLHTKEVTIIPDLTNSGLIVPCARRGTRTVRLRRPNAQFRQNCTGSTVAVQDQPHVA